MRAAESLFERRKRRVRYGIAKNNKGGRVRLSIFRSSKHIYAQLIDDKNGATIAHASSLEKEVAGAGKNGCNVEAAKKVGQLIAKRAVEAKVAEAVFDRGGYLYHGRVMALAESARENGLKL